MINYRLVVTFMHCQPIELQPVYNDLPSALGAARELWKYYVNNGYLVDEISVDSFECVNVMLN